MSPPSAPGSAYRPFLSVRRLRGDRGGQPSKSTILRMRSRPCAGSGNGYSRNSYFPGSTSVAASTPWAVIAESLSLRRPVAWHQSRVLRTCGEPSAERFPAGVRGVARGRPQKFSFKESWAMRGGAAKLTVPKRGVVDTWVVGLKLLSPLGAINWA